MRKNLQILNKMADSLCAVRRARVVLRQRRPADHQRTSGRLTCGLSDCRWDDTHCKKQSSSSHPQQAIVKTETCRLRKKRQWWRWEDPDERRSSTPVLSWLLQRQFLEQVPYFKSFLTSLIAYAVLINKSLVGCCRVGQMHTDILHLKVSTKSFHCNCLEIYVD